MAKFTNIGTLRTRKTKDNKDQRYLVLNPNIELRDKTTGAVIDVGQYRQVKLFSAADGLQTRLGKGSIDQAKFEASSAKNKEKGIMYDLVVVEDDANQNSGASI